MEIAKSMYLGGKSISASSSKVTSHSSRELGLRCEFCGEPVFYRSGSFKKPHFAHFPSIDPQKYEECLIRQKNINGNSLGDCSWWLNDAHEQRFDLFQEHFFYILKSEINELDISPLNIAPEDVNFDYLQKDTLIFSIKYKKQFLNYMRVFDEDLTYIERCIIAEAFDYLTVASSKNIFLALYEHVTRNSTEKKHDRLRCPEICCEILSLIKSIKWLKNFTRITGISPPNNQNIKPRPKTFIRKLEQGKKSVYLRQGRIWLASVECCRLIYEKQIAVLELSKFSTETWAARKVKVYSPEKLSRKMFALASKGDFFSFHETSIEKLLIPRLCRAMKQYSDDGRFDSVNVSVGKNEWLVLEKRIGEFLDSGGSRIFLKSGDEVIFLAEINIKSSKLKYKDYYSFNGQCIRTIYDHFDTAIQWNPLIGVAIFDIVKELHKLISKQ